jgi:hypothetical protein
MTLVFYDGRQAVIVLDPAKKNAVLSHSMETANNIIERTQLAGYMCIAGQWIPKTIYIERLEGDTGKLKSSDLWRFESIDPALPASHHIKAHFAPQAQIEYFSPVMEKPLIFCLHEGVDTDTLLGERLALEVGVSYESQNCGAACLGYIAAKLNKDIDHDKIRHLMNKDKNMTLETLVNLAGSQGLVCRAVRTAIDTLQDLNGMHVILHLADKNHFVVLESIDNKQAWFLDLTKRRVYYPVNTDLLKATMPETVALLVADRPLVAWSTLAELTQAELANVKGSGLVCSYKYQNGYTVPCFPDELCQCDEYLYYTNIWKCKSGNGYCSEYWTPWLYVWDCVLDPYEPLQCQRIFPYEAYYTTSCDP